MGHERDRPREGQEESLGDEGEREPRPSPATGRDPRDEPEEQGVGRHEARAVLPWSKARTARGAQALAPARGGGRPGAHARNAAHASFIRSA